MLLAPAHGPLVFGSAKSVVGHTEPAAGALGLVQLALELGHSALAPLLHLARPSAHVVSTLRAGGSGGRAVFIPRLGAPSVDLGLRKRRCKHPVLAALRSRALMPTR